MPANAININSPRISPLVTAVDAAKLSYELLIRNWNDARKQAGSREAGQLHPFEAGEIFSRRRADLVAALDNLLRGTGIIPFGWESLFPPIEIKREGDTVHFQPPGWTPGREKMSRRAVWRFLLDDTFRLARVIKQTLTRFGDDLPEIYPILHQAWGYRAISRCDLRLNLHGSENMTPVGNIPSIVASTHDSALEFAVLPGILFEYGLQVYLMADRKFFSWGPPTFGLLRLLCGPMELYGHLPIDRSDDEKALAELRAAGAFISTTGRSLGIFPQATRTPVCRDADGNRFEGPMYGCTGGLALILEGSPRHPCRPDRFQKRRGDLSKTTRSGLPAGRGKDRHGI